MHFESSVDAFDPFDAPNEFVETKGRKLAYHSIGMGPLTFPQAGHGRHHQNPQAAGDYLATFAGTTP